MRGGGGGGGGQNIDGKAHSVSSGPGPFATGAFRTARPEPSGPAVPEGDGAGGVGGPRARHPVSGSPLDAGDPRAAFLGGGWSLEIRSVGR